MRTPVFVEAVLKRQIFAPMVMAHAVEAFGAALLASEQHLRVGEWTLQTLLIGYPSLRLLTKQRTTDGFVVALFVLGLFCASALIGR